VAFALGLYGTVTAYELSSGEQLWQNNVGDGEWTQETAPVLLDGSVIVPQSDGTEVSIHALDATSGDEQWRVSVPDARVRGPVAASGHLVATSQDRHVNVRGTPDSPPTGTIRAYELED
jgi:outer membrane protein assembly factor BamB